MVPNSVYMHGQLLEGQSYLIKYSMYLQINRCSKNGDLFSAITGSFPMKNNYMYITNIPPRGNFTKYAKYCADIHCPQRIIAHKCCVSLTSTILLTCAVSLSEMSQQLLCVLQLHLLQTFMVLMDVL